MFREVRARFLPSFRYHSPPRSQPCIYIGNTSISTRRDGREKLTMPAGATRSAVKAVKMCVKSVHVLCSNVSSFLLLLSRSLPLRRRPPSPYRFSEFFVRARMIVSGFQLRGPAVRIHFSDDDPRTAWSPLLLGYGATLMNTEATWSFQPPFRYL